MQFAHELGHILNQDSGVLYFTALSAIKTEAEATKTGLSILLDYYLQENDIDDFNIDNFIKLYQVPTQFVDYIYKLINKKKKAPHTECLDYIIGPSLYERKEYLYYMPKQDKKLVNPLSEGRSYYA